MLFNSSALSVEIFRVLFMLKQQPCSLFSDLLLQHKYCRYHTICHTLFLFRCISFFGGICSSVPNIKNYYMETTKMKIEYRKLTDNESDPWQLLTNIDELIWNGVYVLRVSDDDGTHGLPFRFSNDETVTLVLKDHAHEGKLQNSRTVVQTITRVELATGKVLNYTRTRYCVDGHHSWSFWKLGTETDSDSGFDLSLIEPLQQQANKNALDISDEVTRAKQAEKNIVRNMHSNIPYIQMGALQHNDVPYTGTNYCAYTDPVTGEGEIVVADDYYITSIKLLDFNGMEIDFINEYNDRSFAFEGELNYQFCFRKKDSTAFDVGELSRIVRSFRVYPVKWNKYSNMDNYTCNGAYDIKGKRENNTDNMPISNTGNVIAHLDVLSDENCATQLLSLLNVAGGDGNLYTRTRQAGNWGMWGKLQTNVEVGSVGLGQEKTFDNLTDNGIYSGVNVYSVGSDNNGYPVTSFETFVLVVINAYLTGGGVAQLKYSLLLDGTVSVRTRSLQGDIWSEWKPLF